MVQASLKDLLKCALELDTMYNKHKIPDVLTKFNEDVLYIRPHETSVKEGTAT